VTHDAAGDVEFDGRNSYLYDAEGRVCAVSNPSITAEYLYDADGNLAAVGSVNSLSCNPSSNGFSITNSYIRGLNGEQVSETDGAGHWYHTNVFANGQLLATYGASETFFALNDWLGTKRVEVTPDGGLASFASLPFGDDLTTSGNLPDATENHYTSKERDTESGNDYFGARYYASTAGRWLSPDPSGLALADPSDPQSLNLYAYVGNQPLGFVDPYGLSWFTADRCSGTAYSTTSLFGDIGHFVANLFTSCENSGPSGDDNPDGGDLPGGGEFGSSSQRGATTSISLSFQANNNAGNKGVCSETDEQIVRDASVSALSRLNPKQNESRNITPFNFNFARVQNPKAILTTGWKNSFTTHGTAIESPIIPGQDTFDVKMYADPKLGNTIAVVYPTSSPMHFLQWPLYEAGVHVNAANARSYMGCSTSSGGH
jgi:RHS repeat-associated protein